MKLHISFSIKMIICLPKIDKASLNYLMYVNTKHEMA